MTLTTVAVDRDVFADKRQKAAAMRDAWTRQGTLVVNLVSSPGAGKTSLLQAMARCWNGKYRMAVLVGDLATDRDAERLRPFVPVQQLTTGGACHLELPLIERGVSQLPQERWDFLIIENIGNLVCPASHDLSEHLRVVLLSTTEGDDKPGKYPKMFRTSQAMVISKSDLLPWVPFSPEAAIQDARLIQPDLACLITSAQSGAGVLPWCQYLENARARLLGDQMSGASSCPTNG